MSQISLHLNVERSAFFLFFLCRNFDAYLHPHSSSKYFISSWRPIWATFKDFHFSLWDKCPKAPLMGYQNCKKTPPHATLTLRVSISLFASSSLHPKAACLRLEEHRRRGMFGACPADVCSVTLSAADIGHKSQEFWSLIEGGLGVGPALF